MPVSLSHLQELEAEAIHALREAAAVFRKPVILYSIGKDSSVLVRLARKAFHPGPVPFPLLHVDTGYKFPEMIAFRDRFAACEGLDLRVFRSREHFGEKVDPAGMGTGVCCGLLKTGALLEALRAHGFDGALGGARREEERSRAKERIFSFRDAHGHWDPRRQRPELWNLFNLGMDPGQGMRVFPLSNWTELDVWDYIRKEAIPVVPLYFAKPRRVRRQGGLILLDPAGPETLSCRLRSLRCAPCSGAIESRAATVDEIIDELRSTRYSERQGRLIDFDKDGSMELKKQEGYF